MEVSRNERVCQIEEALNTVLETRVDAEDVSHNCEYISVKMKGKLKKHFLCAKIISRIKSTIYCIKCAQLISVF
jgi:hypothetical protein